MSQTTFDPESVGIPRVAAADLRGGDRRHNADVVRRLLDGERGPVRDAVVLNAAAGVVAYEGPSADGLVDQLGAAIRAARLRSTAASGARKLDSWIAASQSARAHT